MKKILTLILCLMFLGVNATFAAESNSTENAVQNKTAAEKQKVKRCPCKKIFEKTLGLTPEQIKLADKNRADEKKEIKAVNKKIKKLKSKKQSEKNMKKINSRFRIGGTSIRMPSQFCNIALFILASSDFCIFWGDSLVFFELTNEIADVVKATVNGNIRNRQ